MIRLSFANAWHLNDRLYVIEEMGCNIYLIRGDEKVLVLDTAYGLTDLRAAAKQLCGDLPVICVNTHEHGDHNSGNSQFESVYVGRYGEPASHMKHTPESKKALYERIADRLEGMPFVYEDWNPGASAHVEPLEDGDVLELGGVCLKVIETPGHTAGGIALYEEERRWLFVGDTVLAWEVWGQLGNSVALRYYMRSLENLAEYENRVDAVFSGHSVRVGEDETGRFVLSPEALGIYAEGTRAIVEGRDRGMPYEEKNPRFSGCRYSLFRIGGMAFDPDRI